MKLLWHYIEESAGRTPDATAVRHNGEVSYATLAEDGNRFANLLLRHGIRRGERIGLHLAKSSRCVTAMFGASRSGNCYVPIDPGQPALRAARVVAECGARVLVTAARGLQPLAQVPRDLHNIDLVVLTEGSADPDLLPGAEVVEWDAVLAEEPTVRAPVQSTDVDPAYLLFTSGSTGTPKGVTLSHRHATGFVDWVVNTFKITSRDILSNHAPFHFDLSVLDLYAAFAAGAVVAPVPERVHHFPTALAQWIEDTAISVWYSVPSVLVQLMERGDLDRRDLGRLRCVLFAGERFPVRHLRRLMEILDGAELHNLYGPTETNVCTFYTVPRPFPDEIRDLPIGRACGNIDVMALLEDDKPAQPGECGELCVRGSAVMLGYWNRPEETSRVLTRNPHQPEFHDWIYRTGDFVRLGPDGDYDLVGRRDHMVKSRGYRIEIGEVEVAVNSYPGVEEAVVVAVPDEEIGCRLIALVVPEGGAELEPADVLRHCRARLPNYAVPAHIEIRSEMPRMSSGKADRQRLASEVGA